MGGIRMTYTTAMVLQALDLGYRYGFDIAEATGLRGGTVYPILRRLEDAGMARSQWEKVQISRDEGRPPRKYYTVAPAADELIATARARYPLRGVRATARGAEGLA
jgi:DNA-binding PadR family transcriptional regulator